MSIEEKITIKNRRQWVMGKEVMSLKEEITIEIGGSGRRVMSIKMSIKMSTKVEIMIVKGGRG